jgi:hypothetical protein
MDLVQQGDMATMDRTEDRAPYPHRVVDFNAAARRAHKNAEEAVHRAGQLYQRRLRAMEDLPRVLAALIEAGHSQVALEAVLRWGKEGLHAADVLDWCEREAAVLGIRSAFEGP